MIDDDLRPTEPPHHPRNCVRADCPVQALGDHPLHEEDFPPETQLFGDPRALTFAELLERRAKNEPHGARLWDVTAEKKHEARLKSYRKLRSTLIAILGGCCARCGAEEGDQDDQDRTVHLCFDHIKNDRTWSVRKANRWTRIARYGREAKEGRIQLLCDSCNVRKENDRRKTQKARLTKPTETRYKSARLAASG